MKLPEWHALLSLCSNCLGWIPAFCRSMRLHDRYPLQTLIKSLGPFLGFPTVRPITSWARTMCDLHAVFRGAINLLNSSVPSISLY
ncbi:hypothetical protein F5B20DRAFT_547301 [Whalleya microplaca]|nr:hypothetical protein F5B20DRAFT_547301 [Whalleya microplaca]